MSFNKVWKKIQSNLYQKGGVFKEEIQTKNKEFKWEDSEYDPDDDEMDKEWNNKVSRKNFFEWLQNIPIDNKDINNIESWKSLDNKYFNNSTLTLGLEQGEDNVKKYIEDLNKLISDNKITIIDELVKLLYDKLLELKQSEQRKARNTGTTNVSIPEQKQLGKLTSLRYIGLKNNGNTCFFNSALQLIYSMPEVYLGLKDTELNVTDQLNANMQEKIKNDTMSCLNALKTILSVMYEEANKKKKLIDFNTNKTQKYINILYANCGRKEMRIGVQEDSIDILEPLLLGIIDYVPLVSKYFYYNYKFIHECLNKDKLIDLEDIMDSLIRLDINKGKISELITDYLNNKVFNDYRYNYYESKCGKIEINSNDLNNGNIRQLTGTRQINFDKENKYFIVVLNRKNYSSNTKSKNNIIADNIKIDNNNFEPYGCILHTGDFTGGHYRYIAYKDGKPYSVMDDSKIDPITTNIITEINTEGYVYLYKRIDGDSSIPASSSVLSNSTTGIISSAPASSSSSFSSSKLSATTPAFEQSAPASSSSPSTPASSSSLTTPAVPDSASSSIKSVELKSSECIGCSLKVDPAQLLSLNKIISDNINKLKNVDLDIATFKDMNDTLTNTSIILSNISSLKNPIEIMTIQNIDHAVENLDEFIKKLEVKLKK